MRCSLSNSRQTLRWFRVLSLLAANTSPPTKAVKPDVKSLSDDELLFAIRITQTISSCKFINQINTAFHAELLKEYGRRKLGSKRLAQMRSSSSQDTTARSNSNPGKGISYDEQTCQRIRCWATPCSTTRTSSAQSALTVASCPLLAASSKASSR